MGPKELILGLKRADFLPIIADFGPERGDFRSNMNDFGSVGPILGLKELDIGLIGLGGEHSHGHMDGPKVVRGCLKLRCHLMQKFFRNRLH